MKKGKKNETDVKVFEKKSKEVEELLEFMRIDITWNDISVKAFKEYYTLLKNAIKSETTKNPLPYLFILSNSTFLKTTIDEFEEIQKIRDDLEKSIRETMGDKINVLYTLNEIPTNCKLTLKQFCDYCDKLRLAKNIKFEGINIKESVQKLYNSEVNDLFSYDDCKKCHDYRQFLASIINEPVNKEAKIKMRKINS